MSQWMERSLEMEEQGAVVRELGTLQVDLHNFVRRRVLNKSSGIFCAISHYDHNVNWVQCDSCSQWFHLLCEGFASSEILKVKSLES